MSTHDYDRRDLEARNAELRRRLRDAERERNTAERVAEELAKERSAAVDAAHHWKWRADKAERERDEAQEKLKGLLTALAFPADEREEER